ncbi:MAG: DUF3108 domain-containing protein [Candidatus Cloacimonetes bacterium]|nr:DUF3108 domain-containing protein [Candidatus Cloacimonadota bacterium]
MRKTVFTLLFVLSLTLIHGVFESGETLTFKVKYGAITAGKATLTIVEDTFQDSVPIYRITSSARTNSFFDAFFKVRDEIESIWHRDSLVAIRFTKQLREGNYRQLRVHNYFPDLGFSIYSVFDFRKSTFSDRQMDIPANTQDILSAMYTIRREKLTPGTSVWVDVVADGRSYRAEVRVLKRERIKTIFGRTNCIVLEPILEGEAIFKQTGKILIWMTDDKWHIPVRIQSKIVFGSFYAILTDAENVPLKLD